MNINTTTTPPPPINSMGINEPPKGFGALEGFDGINISENPMANLGGFNINNNNISQNQGNFLFQQKKI